MCYKTRRFVARCRERNQISSLRWTKQRKANECADLYIKMGLLVYGAGAGVVECSGAASRRAAAGHKGDGGAVPGSTHGSR